MPDHFNWVNLRNLRGWANDFLHKPMLISLSVWRLHLHVAQIADFHRMVCICCKRTTTNCRFVFVMHVVRTKPKTRQLSGCPLVAASINSSKLKSVKRTKCSACSVRVGTRSKGKAQCKMNVCVRCRREVAKVFTSNFSLSLSLSLSLASSRVSLTNAAYHLNLLWFYFIFFRFAFV